MRVLHAFNGILPVYVRPAYRATGMISKNVLLNTARGAEKVPNLRCEKEDQPATPFAV